MFRVWLADFTDTIDKWDTNKLEEVVKKKHSTKTKTKTEIVSELKLTPSLYSR